MGTISRDSSFSKHFQIMPSYLKYCMQYYLAGTNSELPRGSKDQTWKYNLLGWETLKENS